MGDIYIRGLDERVKRQLMQEAGSKGISLNRYIGIILEDHASAPALRAMEDKFSDLAKDMTSLYIKLIERTEETIEENTTVIMDLRRYLEEKDG